MLPDGKSFERSDEDERLIGEFKNSFDSVDAIPASLIKAAEELRVAEDFEKWGEALVRSGNCRLDRLERRLGGGA